MFICVDGSGPFSGVEYRAEFANSYLAQIVRHNTQAFARRAIGPNMVGLRQVTPESLVGAIRRRYDEGADDAGDTTVFLGGYSRGAATVVHVAALLEREGITVDAMFLFDAVDRSPWIGDSLPDGNVDVVPANVLRTYHARRDPHGESRMSFDSTATRAARPHSYEQEFFMTTHGGMGGVPFGYTGLETGRWTLGDEYLNPATTPARRDWIRRHGVLWEDSAEMVAALATGDPSDGVSRLTMAQEEAGSAACIRWMWPHLLRHGVVTAGSTPVPATRRGHFEERF